MTDGPSIHRYIQLSAQDFAALGAQQIAYVKPIALEGELRFEIHAADGTPVALVDSADVAFAAVRQNGLEPLSVH
ncbi:MAG: DUF1150 family protein [Alphaproteobacteria bacterium]|nr:DUF1150 family protein [Alphaproteobacteria bacterium]